MRMLVGRWVAVVAVGLAGLAAAVTDVTAEQIRSDPLQSYGALVLRYAGGEQQGAAQEARRMPLEELRRDLERLRWLKANAEDRPHVVFDVAWCPRCPFADAWKRFPLLSSIMLHADAAWPQAAPEWFSPRSEADPDNDQLAMVTNLLDLIVERDGNSGAAARVCSAIGRRLMEQTKLGLARSWASLAVKRFPRDAELLLLAGTVKETIGSQPIDSVPTGDAHGIALFRRLQSMQDRRADLLEAAALLDRALQAQPDLPEARLRLGRVDWRLKRNTEAESNFRRVLTSTSPDPVFFLAHLFIARLHQDAGRFEEAATAYRTALGVYPQAQSALVGLSYALYRNGDDASSREAIERTLAAVGRRQLPDPFWNYPWVLRASDESWDALRRDALRELQ